MVKPHVVCVPYPALAHINPMIKLAKLFHHKGFHVSFVLTEYFHSRLLKIGGPNYLSGLSDFRYHTISDGLPPSDPDEVQDFASLCASTAKHSLEPFCELISKLNKISDVPPVSCIVSDGIMSFTHKAAEKFGLPEVLFWTTSACGLLGFLQYPELVERRLTPLKDFSDMYNGYLEQTLDWVPGMTDIRLKDIPSFIRTTDPNDIFLNFLTAEVKVVPKATALILNTFDSLEHQTLDAISAINPHTYAIGPLNLMMNHVKNDALKTIYTNFYWKEEDECMDWLNKKEKNSVVFVNFGIFLVMPKELLAEFAWGLANSGKSFLWSVPPELVAGDMAMLPEEFVAETKDRGLFISMCTLEQVLNHSAIGGFVIYGEWNWVLESINGGVPVIYWPFFGEQMTNCRYSCVEWGIGMEIDMNVKRDDVEGIIKEVIDGEKGKVIRKRVLEWKEKAHEAIGHGGGSSYLKFDKLLAQLLG